VNTPITIAWTGASGLIYGWRLAEVLLLSGHGVRLLVSDAVRQTAPVEMGGDVDSLVEKLSGLGSLEVLNPDNFSSPVASGSAQAGPMVVVPCSMGTVGRMVAGTSETLLLRAADVCFKERRTLIIVPRETPMATHHLENLATLSGRGALIIPAAPGFYHGPRTISDLVDFIVQRICDHLGVSVDISPRWGNPES
jgi:flavin prenyltransferase